MSVQWRALPLACALCGCGEQVPPVEPLSADPAELSRLYKWGSGPWSARMAPEWRISHPKRDGELRIRVHYPAYSAPGTNASAHPSPAEKLPVLLFSHGFVSSNDRYDSLIEHWVSHGYVVAAPLHRDGDGGFLAATIDMVRFGNLGVIQARLDDLVAVLDALPDLARHLPETASPLDLARIGATGHSFGAFNAQQFGGAKAYDTDSGIWVDSRDDRIKAVVAISPPGPMFDEIAEDSWRQLDLPTLVTTGTRDTNPAFWRDWRLHKLSFETAVPGNQFALVVQGADHYFGNLIARLDRNETPQSDALALTNTVAVAFLDTYLKQSAAARDFLRSPQLANVTRGFAVLESR